MTPLPVQQYITDGLPPEQAFAEWRTLMSPLFGIEKAPYAAALPRGNVTTFLLGEIIVNRCTFNAQRFTRDSDRIAATPDHLVLQLYRAGGFHGRIGDRTVTIGRRQVAICDLRLEVDARAAASDTIGLAIPRRKLRGLDLRRLPPVLDPARNGALAARMAVLPRQLARADATEAGALADDLLAFLRGVLDPKRHWQDGEEPAPDTALIERAKEAIRREMHVADLTPGQIAEALGVSRATLYRVFAPLGGVSRHMQEQRLQAIHDALCDPLDTRSLAQFASDLGFGTPAHLSRSFRVRFQRSPRALREQVSRDARSARQRSPEPVQHWWSALGD